MGLIILVGEQLQIDWLRAFEYAVQKYRASQVDLEPLTEWLESEQGQRALMNPKVSSAFLDMALDDGVSKVVLVAQRDRSVTCV